VQFFDVNGIELDVQDPRFFIDEELMFAQQEAIAEMLSTYA
jgi:hypothetical protein